MKFSLGKHSFSRYMSVNSSDDELESEHGYKDLSQGSGHPQYKDGHWNRAVCWTIANIMISSLAVIVVLSTLTGDCVPVDETGNNNYFMKALSMRCECYGASYNRPIGLTWVPSSDLE